MIGAETEKFMEAGDGSILAADLFDSIVYDSNAANMFDDLFAIVGFPGTLLGETVLPDDVVIRRGLANAGGAQIGPARNFATLLSPRRARLPLNTLILRPKLRTNGRASLTSPKDAFAAPAPAGSEDAPSAEAAAAFIAVAGAIISGAQLGLGVFDRIERKLLSGKLSAKADQASYIHDPSPRGLTQHTRRFFFALSAFHPRYGFGRQKFYFEATLEYDGFNIRRASIVVDRGKSSELTSSSFDINFRASRISARNEPVAVIAYNISGEWDPFGRGVESFDGRFLLDAQGRFRGLRINSPQGWVRPHGRVTQRGGGAVPKPTRAVHATSVHFDRPGGKRLSQAMIRHVAGWYNRLPTSVRDEISAGRLPIELTGRASTTASVQHNQQLGRERANAVARALRDAAGSDSRFRIRSQGELGARTPDNREDRNERRVDIEVSYTVYR